MPSVRLTMAISASEVWSVTPLLCGVPVAMTAADPARSGYDRATRRHVMRTNSCANLCRVATKCEC
jgi:hypothetical protein